MAGSDKEVATSEQLFALVGNAITQWSFVEHELCSIFMVCTSSFCVSEGKSGISYTDSALPTSVFYSVENLRGKLALLNAVISTRFSQNSESAQSVRDAWEKLLKKTQKLSIKRNRLAHYTVLPEINLKDQSVHARLLPAYGSPAYFRESGLNQRGLTIEARQLDHLVTAFSLLAGKLGCFKYVVAHNEELFDKSVQLMARQIDEYRRIYPTRAERLIRASLPPE